MDAYDIGYALIAFLAVVAIAPVWYWFAVASPYVAELSIEGQFLAALSLPGMLMLLLAGWVR